VVLFVFFLGPSKHKSEKRPQTSSIYYIQTHFEATPYNPKNMKAYYYDSEAVTNTTSFAYYKADNYTRATSARIMTPDAQ
jgi:hypothetical protein